MGLVLVHVAGIARAAALAQARAGRFMAPGALARPWAIVGPMSLRRLLPLVFAVLAFGTGSARAGDPQTAPADEGAYQQARATAQSVKTRAEVTTAAKFERDGCLADPKKCRCQHEDPAKSNLCSGMLGYFCPDSTERYLASSCMNLFGKATLCQCAANQQIQAYVKAEDAAQAAADKKAAAKAKKPAAKK